MESSRLRKAKPISLPSIDSHFYGSVEGGFCALLSDPFPSLQESTSRFHPRHVGNRKELLQNFFGRTHSREEGFPGSSVVKNPPINTGDVEDMGSILGSRRCPGVGNGNPLQYSCLENSMDGGACLSTVHGVNNMTAHTHDISRKQPSTRCLF